MSDLYKFIEKHTTNSSRIAVIESPSRDELKTLLARYVGYTDTNVIEHRCTELELAQWLGMHPQFAERLHVLCLHLGVWE